MALTKITPQMFDTSAAGHDFNIDNGTFVVDASANRVGIGTTTPSTLLDVNGVLTATSIAGTLTTAAQTNITSLGTLTGLTIGGDLTLSGASSPKITITDTTNTVSLLIYSQDADAIIGTYTNHPLKLFSNSSVALTFDTSQNATFAGTIAGTLATAAQPNITSLGTLTGLNLSGNVFSGNKTGLTDTNTGHAIAPGGLVYHTTDGTITQSLHRLTDDGPVLRLVANGSTAGSVGVLSGGLSFGTGTAMTTRMTISSSGATAFTGNVTAPNLINIATDSVAQTTSARQWATIKNTGTGTGAVSYTHLTLPTKA